MPSVDPWFGKQHLPPSSSEYIVWMDLMGTSAILDWKLIAGAINIGKFHTAAIESDHSDELNIYPMMDGIYATSKEDDVLAGWVADIYHRFSHILTNRHEGYQNSELIYAPILRTGVAYGEVFHGYDLSDSPLAKHNIAGSILIGDAVAKAHRRESEAPPLGIRLDKSASDDSSSHDQEWWPNEVRGEEILKAYEAYLSCFERNSSIRYSDDKIDEHRDMARDYFP